jgi:hypothetical protein
MPTTSVQPNDYRRERGALIAATTRICRESGTWVVPGQIDGTTRYIVGGDTCSCPGYATLIGRMPQYSLWIEGFEGKPRVGKGPGVRSGWGAAD